MIIAKSTCNSELLKEPAQGHAGYATRAQLVPTTLDCPRRPVNQNHINVVANVWPDVMQVCGACMFILYFNFEISIAGT